MFMKQTIWPIRVRKTEYGFNCCFLRMSHAKTMFLITFYIHFWSILSQFWVDLRVPGGSLGQLEARLAPPSTQGWLQGPPGTHPGGQKPLKTTGKTRVFIKSKKKWFFVSNTWTTWKLSCDARRTAFFKNFVTQEKRPKQFSEHHKWSSRVGESSIFNIFEKMKYRRNAGSRLPFFEDAWGENTGFDDTVLSAYPPLGDSKISIFEGWCEIKENQWFEGVNFGSKMVVWRS